MIVLKILMWILLAVLGLILLALILPASAKISYIGGKFSYSVKYSFLPVLDSNGEGILNKLKGRKNKVSQKEDSNEICDGSDIFRSEETSEKDKTEGSELKSADNIPEENDDASEKEKNSVPKKSKKKRTNAESEEKKSKLESIIELWEAADRPVLKIFKGIKLSELYIDFIIANEDAYKCALNYGRVSGAVYQLLGWLSVLFNVKLKTIDIIPGFSVSKSCWDASVKISFNLMTSIIAGIWFLLIYIFKIFIPSRKKKKLEVR